MNQLTSVLDFEYSEECIDFTKVFFFFINFLGSRIGPIFTYDTLNDG